MYQYIIRLGKEQAEQLECAAKESNMSAENFIKQILNKYLVPLHSMDQDELARGYQEMAQINLELCK